MITNSVSNFVTGIITTEQNRWTVRIYTHTGDTMPIPYMQEGVLTCSYTRGVRTWMDGRTDWRMDGWIDG